MTIKDVAVFESTALSLEPTVLENGKAADLPLGIDLARHVIKHIQIAKPQWEIAEPICEDYGSVFHIGTANGAFWVTTQWVPLEKKDNCWAIWFRQSYGCLWFFNRRASGSVTLKDLKIVIDEIIRSDAQRFTNLRWLSEEEFHTRV